MDGLAFLEEVYQTTRQHLDTDVDVDAVKAFTDQLRSSKFMKEVYETTYRELAEKAAREHP